MKASLAAVLGLALSLNANAQVDNTPEKEPLGIGGSASTTIGNASSHNLGNGITGRSFKSGTITRHSFNNGVTGTSYEYGNKSTHHFSNGITGRTYQYGNQSTTRLSNGKTISCHTFGTVTRCN